MNQWTAVIALQLLLATLAFGSVTIWSEAQESARLDQLSALEQRRIASEAELALETARHAQETAVRLAANLEPAIVDTTATIVSIDPDARLVTVEIAGSKVRDCPLVGGTPETGLTGWLRVAGRWEEQPIVSERAAKPGRRVIDIRVPMIAGITRMGRWAVGGRGEFDMADLSAVRITAEHACRVVGTDEDGRETVDTVEVLSMWGPVLVDADALMSQSEPQQ